MCQGNSLCKVQRWEGRMHLRNSRGSMRWGLGAWGEAICRGGKQEAHKALRL